MARHSKATRKTRARFAISAKPKKPKKIVLFSDGTGNSSAKAEKTNVWRMFNALDQVNARQIAAYDDGVGTSSNKYIAAVTGAFGWGLKRNVLDLYKFVCRNYVPGDEICGFGFSRGSFTIRVLVGLIVREGLVTFRSEEELQRNAAAAYRNYRSKGFPTWSPIVGLARFLRNCILRVKDWVKGYRTYEQIQADVLAQGRTGVRIRFLGLWDTVEAYGMPVAELKRGIDWVLWPMMFGDLKLSPQVDRACHVLSLDDERTTFHPLIWDEEAEAKLVAKKAVPPGRLKQVWFAGMHSNVGGGYPEDQLSLVSLEWMMDEAIANGLVLHPECVRLVQESKSPYARIYDSRAGLASYFRYSPRRIPIWKFNKTEIKPIVHWSVILRMANGSDGFAPISLPPNFWVLAPDGELLPMQGFSRTLRLQSKSQVQLTKSEVVAAIQSLTKPDQEAVSLVWDTVWWRRSLYFLTVALTAALATYPWIGESLVKNIRRLLERIPVIGRFFVEHWDEKFQVADSATYGFIQTTLAAASGFIPGYLSPWIESIKNSTMAVAILIIAIALSFYGGRMLQSRIHDRAQLAWRNGKRRSDYSEWFLESERGWRHGMLLGLAIALSIVGLLYLLPDEFHRKGWYWPTQIQLLVVAALFACALLWRLGRKAKLRMQGQRPTPDLPLRSTPALRVARTLRKNPFLNLVFRFTFKGVVPVLFAVALIVLGLMLVNRAVFDAVSATGYFCKRSLQAEIFNVDEICHDTREEAKKGHRYQVTLTFEALKAPYSPNIYNWFDKTTPTDAMGFAASSPEHYIATLMKRWWGQNWFKPIIRVGEIGNDEYPLNPVPRIEARLYCTDPENFGGKGVNVPSLEDRFDRKNPQWAACESCNREKSQAPGGVSAKIAPSSAEAINACSLVPKPGTPLAQNPETARKFTSEFTARTSGRIYIYVNDAVLMLPTLTNVFYLNNAGSATVAIKDLGIDAGSN